ncbi:type IV toxin-antitoxin system AbiEi family antitoxin [Geobacter sp. DSM 9736]|uniref:type IV toxin-antitoxin system AbiEi family antitoxin n=1 Tax=Geobacter sp. DSM 9736 TaxID=1277350 RepID=UPI000B4FDA13|nr:type IV toxin-antitoxin system AbiEi family antitoxin [Geobacter sp. DSM 9736]SNB47473.1 Transcriptional regulator, predicted component of viral defense system [Geobacter sp. DSM 9736]
MYLGLVDSLAAEGRSCFTYQEFLKLSGSSEVAVKSALHRLLKKGEIAMPYRGFYVILLPMHRSVGCVPPAQFIPDLMEHLGEVYYAGLLSAAEYHGAAHQRPQIFQVMVAKVRRPITCGNIRVQFVYRKNAAAIPTEFRNTTAGTIKVSTPEATALDVVGYVSHCAGLDNVATILIELAECIDPKRLVEVAELSPVSYAQRLGYLLELLGEKDKVVQLAEYVRKKCPVPTALLPRLSIKGAAKDRQWQVYINTTIEPDI